MIAQQSAEISKIVREIKAEEEVQKMTEKRDDGILEDAFITIQYVCD